MSVGTLKRNSRPTVEKTIQTMVINGATCSGVPRVMRLGRAKAEDLRDFLQSKKGVLLLKLEFCPFVGKKNSSSEYPISLVQE